jgi:hypothetical protein
VLADLGGSQSTAHVAEAATLSLEWSCFHDNLVFGIAVGLVEAEQQAKVRLREVAEHDNSVPNLDQLYVEHVAVEGDFFYSDELRSFCAMGAAGCVDRPMAALQVLPPTMPPRVGRRVCPPRRIAQLPAAATHPLACMCCTCAPHATTSRPRCRLLHRRPPSSRATIPGCRPRNGCVPHACAACIPVCHCAEARALRAHKRRRRAQALTGNRTAGLLQGLEHIDRERPPTCAQRGLIAGALMAFVAAVASFMAGLTVVEWVLLVALALGLVIGSRTAQECTTPSSDSSDDGDGGEVSLAPHACTLLPSSDGDAVSCGTHAPLAMHAPACGRMHARTCVCAGMILQGRQHIATWPAACGAWVTAHLHAKAAHALRPPAQRAKRASECTGPPKVPAAQGGHLGSSHRPDAPDTGPLARQASAQC